MQSPADHDLRDACDLTQVPIVAWGRYAEGQRAGSNLRVLDPDVVHAFPTDEAVNAALRRVLHIAWIAQADVRRAWRGIVVG